MTRYLEIKPGSISEVAKKLKEDYQDFFKKELEKTGKSLASMTDAEKKAFYNRIDKEYNAKNEANEPAKPDDSKTTLVAAPGNKEKVIRIPKEKLADYKAKGYVEAESFVPEAAKEPYAIGMAAAMKQTGDKPPLKKSTITKAHDIAKSIEKKEEVELEEGQYKEIDIRKGDLKLAKDKRQALKDKYNAIMANQAQGDENAIGDQIQKLDISIKKQEQELSDIMKKGKQDQKNEAVDPERVQKLNQKIATMTTKVSELDKSKPENKTKEAILKSDIATAKLRLQDLMQKSSSAVKKAVNEANKAKQSYKTLKMSLKKEQEVNNKKKTLTDKPITKIEVNPKIEG